MCAQWWHLIDGSSDGSYHPMTFEPGLYTNIYGSTSCP